MAVDVMEIWPILVGMMLQTIVLAQVNRARFDEFKASVDRRFGAVEKTADQAHTRIDGLLGRKQHG